MKDYITAKWALISVTDKTGLIEFAKELIDSGYYIIASSGTKKFLSENNVKCESIELFTGFPEILGGRVKTLHPKIFGGILADRENQRDNEEIQKHNIPLIDIIVCNLYQFENEPGIETIDIGGVSLIRAGAKNYKYVTCITNPYQYSIIQKELRKYNAISIDTRREFAGVAFNLTSKFDSNIVNFLERSSRDTLSLMYEKVMDLRYGENPHQSASLYRDKGAAAAKTISLINAEILQGKELSYNNIQDIDVAILVIKSFSTPAVCILKHANPCGVAIDENIVTAYRKAREGDPVSSFGGIVGINCEVNEELAKEITSTFIEAVVAQCYTEAAKAVLSGKKNLRVLSLPLDKKLASETYKCVNGGLLVQSSDIMEDNYNEWEVVTKRKPLPAEYCAAKFAFKVARFLKSNAICIASATQTIGIGAGQPNRVGSIKIAVANMKEFGFNVDGAALASDGFFPFKDSITIANDAGIKCIVQPGGSIRDEEVKSACDEHNISMMFTSCRHFLH